jgi:hypothetical protein
MNLINFPELAIWLLMGIPTAIIHLLDTGIAGVVWNGDY